MLLLTVYYCPDFNSSLIETDVEIVLLLSHYD